MDGHTRRENLRQRLQGAKTPISGAVLAAAFQVSRQVIVQDIALLRAQDVPVISTNRGYLILGEACRVHRFKVRHDLSRMEEELNIFVDAGATVRNVTIDHPVYGTLEGKLNLSSRWGRRDVQRFMKAIRAHPEAPLSNIAGGVHYHTVEAPSREALNEIKEALEAAGFLVK